ncbi:MAG TPA: hypothetical protein VNY32_00390 [Candidatus Acidoferrales bacterium]|nr:hypothetical protein [Candidatus Acidoferrales bacterium]
MPFGLKLASKQIQAGIIVAATLSLVGVGAMISRRGGTGHGSGSEMPNADTGGNLFSLPEASPDFVGHWYGVLRASRREPAAWGQPSNGFGTDFVLVDGRVVMKLALWAPPGGKVNRLQAIGIDPTHVRVENEAVLKDNRGALLWVRERADIMLLNKETLECTDTSQFFRDPDFARVVATVQYRGALRRVTKEEAEAHVREYEKKVMRREAETDTSVPDR